MSGQVKVLRMWLIALLGIALVGVSLTTIAQLAIAQQYVPPRRGNPGRREGAGTRFPGDLCLAGKTPLLGLTPADNFGTTTSKTPVLLWHVPKTNAGMAELRVVDSADKELYSTTVPLKDSPGIVSVQLPAKVTNQMEMNKDYQWQFSLLCVQNDPSKNPFVEGVVQRVPIDANLTKALKAASNPRDRASIYAKAGVWYDAVSTLATQRCLKPGDASLATSWKNLLQSVKLDPIVDVPLTRNCRAIN